MMLVRALLYSSRASLTLGSSSESWRLLADSFDRTSPPTLLDSLVWALETSVQTCCWSPAARAASLSSLVASISPDLSNLSADSLPRARHLPRSTQNEELLICSLGRMR